MIVMSQLAGVLQYVAGLIGWALIHGVWQASAAWLLVRACLIVVRPAAAVRHRMLLLALAASIAAPTALAVLAHRAMRDDARRLAEDVAWEARTGVGRDDDPITAASVQAYDAAFDLLPWVAAIWIGGIAVSVARTRFARRRLGRSVRGSASAPHAVVQRVATLAHRMGVDALPVVRVAPDHDSFVAAGSPPALVLPNVALTGTELDAIVLHELAHLRRRDLVLHRVVRAIETGYWWHPAVRSLVRMLEDTREECCDELAVRASADPLALANALLRLAVQAQPVRGHIAAAGGAVESRIRRLLALHAERARERNARRSRACRHRTGADIIVAGRTAALAAVILLATVRMAGSYISGSAAITRSRRLPVAAALAGAVPMRQVTIDAHDPAGRFRVHLINGRVARVSIGRTAVAQRDLRVEAGQLSVRSGARDIMLSVRVDPRGGLTWTPRAAR